MLRPDQIAGGYLADATGLTLVLPRTEFEKPFLVTHATDPAMAVMLDTGERGFMSFASGDNCHWQGALIPGVAIELDETSLFDPQVEGMPAGGLVRIDKRLCIATALEANLFPVRPHLVTLIEDLPMSGDGLQLGFRRWFIIIGHGETRRELHCVDVATKT